VGAEVATIEGLPGCRAGVDRPDAGVDRPEESWVRSSIVGDLE
jgi:hypothetical protein